jgi:predicted nuclease of predicted toxin-antitoxin system
MKFILDAHIQPSLQAFLIEKGFNTSHTKDLPLQNETDDMEIIKVSMQEQRILVTKDSDFLILSS